jgi:hypothetical protein
MCGVSPFVLRTWISQGVLDEPPWTLDEVQKARDTQHPGPRSQAAHGSTAWNEGCACAVCRRAHSDDARTRKRAKAQARLPLERRRKLLAAIYDGQPFREIVRDLGLTSNQVWGLTKTDEEWSTVLEAALTATRRDDLKHGTNAAYVAGCVCSDCREHQRRRLAKDRG